MAPPVEEVALQRPIIQNISLANTNWTPVTVALKTKVILIQCRTDNDILLAFDSAGTTYWTIKGKTAIALDSSMEDNSDPPNTRKFWVKTTKPTKIVEVIESR